METAGNFGVMKEEINDLREGFGELKIRADAAELRIAENEDREIGMTKILLHSLRMQKQLENKCEELEGRERRNNLRIYSVPEKCEGNSMMDFLENLIREKLDVSGEIPIERAHRATGHLTGHSDRPRSIIVRFQNYNVRQRVLQAAWAKKDIRVKDCRIFFDEDFTTQVFKERAKYRQVRKQLQERNIKSRILFPAKLKLFEKNGKVRVFNNPQDATQGLLEYGVNMESPAGEPDLESTLQASGFRMADTPLQEPENPRIAKE
ncbi:hypothetical protein JOQ06_023010 [Pogonophryne albipinna]|uniref:L1 transposable element RRM domain-containing protein n=1 Tax=Pogonophryne albipinna TaxID=1090488 RepID=A0AAD6F5N7_9TELE|nr:hypothetical protein JOQ06_023010 [Pogonophryne albipinna]